MVEFAGDKMTIVEDDDGNASITFDDVGTGRSCGSCTLCCKLLPVPTIGKKANQRCEYQRASKGCSIYHVRPDSCRAWSCRWLADPMTAGMPRPDRCHYVIDVSYDCIVLSNEETGEVLERSALQVWIDPAFPDAHKAPELRAFIDRMGAKWGVVAIIRWGSADGMVLWPPSVSGDKQWHETGASRVPRAEVERMRART